MKKPLHFTNPVRDEVAPALGDGGVLVVALLVHGHVVVGHALLRDEHLLAAVDHEIAALPQEIMKSFHLDREALLYSNACRIAHSLTGLAGWD